MATDVTLDWADGSYNFRLTLDGCTELERRTRIGISTIWSHLRAVTDPTPDDGLLAAEIIRLGLEGGSGGTVGGKFAHFDTAKMIERFVKPAPPAENWKLARVIVGALMMGV